MTDRGISPLAAEPSLAARLRRADRARRLMALVLVAPSLLYIVILFVAPIGLLLCRAAYDPDMSRLAPLATAALARWDGRALPDEPVFAAMAADLKSAQESQTVGMIGKRINYEIPGARSAIVTTARELARHPEAPYRDAMIGADPMWASRDAWVAIERATRAVHDVVGTGVAILTAQRIGTATAATDQ